MKEGYWKTHKFERRSVEDLARKKFCGWNVLLEMIDACDDPTRYNPQDYPLMKERDKALLAAIFETGGRLSEVLQLRKEMFSIGEEWISVKGMPVLKHFRRIKDDDGNTVKTKTIKTTREFTFRRAEPLAEILVAWIDLYATNYLFPSKTKKRKTLSYQRAYQIVTEIGKKIGFDCFPHRLRSERASQLCSEYGYQLQTVMDFMAWESIKVAKDYVHSSLEDMRRLTPQVLYTT